MTTRIITQIGCQRRLRARNVSGGVIPAFGTLILAANVEFDNEGMLLNVTNLWDPAITGFIYGQPHDAAGGGDGGGAPKGEWLSCDGIGFNLEQDLQDGEVGEVTFDCPAYCLGPESILFSVAEACYGIHGFGMFNITSNDPTFPTAVLGGFRVFGPVSIGNVKNTAEDGTISFNPYATPFVAIRCKVNQFFGDGEDGNLL